MSSKTGSKRAGTGGAIGERKKGVTMPVTGISGHAGPDKDPVLHDGVPVLQAADEVLMDLLLADPKVAPLVLVRVSPTAALVLQENVEALQDALLQAGHLPKLIEPRAREELKAEPSAQSAPAAPPSRSASGESAKAGQSGEAGQSAKSRREERAAERRHEDELARMLRRLLKH